MPSCAVWNAQGAAGVGKENNCLWFKVSAALEAKPFSVHLWEESPCILTK